MEKTAVELIMKVWLKKKKLPCLCYGLFLFVFERCSDSHLKFGLQDDWTRVGGNGRGRWMDQHSCTSSTLIIDWQSIYRSRTNHTGIFAKACLRGRSDRGWMFGRSARSLIWTWREVVKLCPLMSELCCACEPQIQTVPYKHTNAEESCVLLPHISWHRCIRLQVTSEQFKALKRKTKFSFNTFHVKFDLITLV